MMNLPDATRQETALQQTAPGRYEATIEAAAVGAYGVGVVAHGPGGFEARQTAGFSVAYPPDCGDTQPDETLLVSLAEQTGGAVLTDPKQVFAPLAVVPRIRTDICRPLLWLAAILLPLDVAVRQLALGREEIAPLLRALLAARRALRRRPPPPEAVTASELLQRRRTRQKARQAARPIPRLRPQQPPHEPPPKSQPALRPDEAEDSRSTAARLLEKRQKAREGSGDA